MRIFLPFLNESGSQSTLKVVAFRRLFFWPTSNQFSCSRCLTLLENNLGLLWRQYSNENVPIYIQHFHIGRNKVKPPLENSGSPLFFRRQKEQQNSNYNLILLETINQNQFGYFFPFFSVFAK